MIVMKIRIGKLEVSDLICAKPSDVVVGSDTGGITIPAIDDEVRDR